MNARDRIAEALKDGDLIRVGKQWLPLTQVERGRIADVMLAVLPDLLTDPEVIEAVADRLDDEGIWRPEEQLAAFAMDAAAKALTGDTA